MHWSAKRCQYLFIFLVVCLIVGNYLSLYVHLRKLFVRKDCTNTDKSKKNFSSEWNAKENALSNYRFNSTKADVQKSFLILIYKFGPFLEKRHLMRFTARKFSPWENCTVKSCELSYNDEDLDKADAVIFHLHMTKSIHEIPMRSNYDQRWIFLTDESPFNTFLYRNQDISNYDGIFNWSMTYRSDSDIFVPYGRTVPLTFPEMGSYVDMSTKTKLVAIMGSNCGGNNERWTYVAELKKLLGEELDIYGRCLRGNTTACPGHFHRDCLLLKSYKFYLAFENSNCREYMTEKVFWNAYEKFAVPVIMGAPKVDCDHFLPPSSFLHVHDFAQPLSLANYLKYLDRHDNEYLKFHEWRKKYKVLNEHGYFGSASFHYCRVCEALCFNNGTHKVYNDMKSFWNKDVECHVS